jgi:hypothetical protein
VSLGFGAAGWAAGNAADSFAADAARASGPLQWIGNQVARVGLRLGSYLFNGQSVLVSGAGTLATSGLPMQHQCLNH